MKSFIKRWQIAGFITTSLLGTLLHFLYDWLNESVLVAPFSGVNESTWEHMKLLFWPMFIFAIVQSFFFKDIKCFWCIKLRGILLGISLIPIIFYTLNGIIGKTPDWLNISIFFISAAAAYIYEARQLILGNIRCGSQKIALGALLVLSLIFILFTFRAPTINLFRDPLTGSYGI